jgi:pyruvate carboxylase
MIATLPRIRSLLVANRGEIAIRVMRAANELGIRTVAIYSQEDRFSLHRTKSDEAYLVGRNKGPIEAYLDIQDILRVARDAKVDAIHPGYGFLSENPEFAQACAAAGIVFIGPTPDTMRSLGNKVAARNLATRAGVPVMPATSPLPADIEECKRLAHGIGYPVMLKASWGGGGRGMRVIENDAQLVELVPVARREAKAAFGNDEIYLEKLVRRAFICSSATVQCNAAIRRWSNAPRPYSSRTRNDRRFANPRSRSDARRSMSMQGQWNFCRMRTRATSISLR